MWRWLTGPASGPRIGASFAKYASAIRGIANSSAASVIRSKGGCRRRNARVASSTRGGVGAIENG